MIVLSGAGKQLVCRILCFFVIAVAQLFQIGPEFIDFCAMQLNADQYPAIGRAVVSVVEQADVPATT